MNKKWMCGLAALSLFASVAFAQTKAISNFGATDEGQRKQALGEYIYAYVNLSGESDDGSKIDNQTDTDGYVVLIEDNGEWVAALENYRLGASTSMGSYDAYPQIAIGFNVGAGYNLSGCTGFKYQFKGPNHIFKAELSSVAADAGYAHYKVVSASTGWITETVQNSQMGQESWVASPNKVDFNPGLIKKFGFEVSTKPEVHNSATTGDLYVKDFECIGTYTEPPPPDFCTTHPQDPSCNVPITLPNGTVITGLNVVPFARSLQITSAKDATVSLFDMQGKQVFSKKVAAGQETVSLENQKQGVYYAVVQSGSQKQTVKVVLK